MIRLPPSIPRLLFILLFLAIAAFLGAHVWKIRFLYLDATVRSQVQSRLEQMEAEQGWLISDIEVRAIDQETVTLDYAPHRKGPDSSRCFRVPLSGSLLLQSCDARP